MQKKFRFINRKKIVFILLSILPLFFFLLLSANEGFAQSLTLDFGKGGGSTTARMVQLVFLMSILSLAPSILVMLTSFTRLIVVLSFLRSALGMQQSPPNTVLVSLALFLTGFIMAPTLQKAYEEGVKPYMEEKMNEEQALEKTMEPIKGFMLTQVREKDLELFLDLSKIDELKSVDQTPLRALIPAFMVSELRRAFEIGFLIFLPFIIIDMLVASILMSMGMMMLPPMMISLPFKVIFFVMIDGWNLLVGSLVKSFFAGG
ncbi:flagellar type III secretion system pore protein FliP [Candidatus Nucleicultrix amoebiphila]|jgi:flagellar biosynthetic protein FliP|uniref:flagellar type III secretion system pore protein FliP n=1 Tax=Candidatus Nucleicultrix amoebiphila TaxID=1509244 RepID=UPI000A26D43F|nr:flagellar type III secretion system pore protein FliP [Candidatus Nucleicultrix amoebiphila]